MLTTEEGKVPGVATARGQEAHWASNVRVLGSHHSSPRDSDWEGLGGGPKMCTFNSYPQVSKQGLGTHMLSVSPSNE